MHTSAPAVKTGEVAKLAATRSVRTIGLPVLQRCGAHACPAGGCSHSASDDEMHASGMPAHGPFQAPRSVNVALASPGRSLGPEVRSAAEHTFDRDFSLVRIHSGGQASRSADDMRAAAYTVGNDIVFGTGRYVPGSVEGRSLLGHELTHVAQQRTAPTAASARPIMVVHDAALEAEAARTADVS